MSADPVFSRLKNLLHENDGICIAECHNDSEAPHFLAKHMKEFAAAGVTTLFVECINHADQDLLDHFQKTGETETELPPRDRHFGRALDWELNVWAKGGQHEELKTAYLAMLTAARECNITIIAMDDRTTNGPQRLELSNPIWTKVIEDNKPENGKYLAHGGFYHFSRLNLEERHIEPVHERLGVPSVHFEVQPEPGVSIKENADDTLAATVTVGVQKGWYSGNVQSAAVSNNIAAQEIAAPSLV